MRNGEAQGLCSEPFCKRRRRKDRTRCYRCANRRFRKANPMKAAFNGLRERARRRRIPFRLSFRVFTRFALATDYLNRTGNGKHCLTVDRINNLRGYTRNNIQPLTREKNCIKQARQDARRMKAGYAWKEKEQ